MGIFDRIFKRKTRAEPSKSMLAWLRDDGTGECCRGYVRLSDNPEVRMALERIAELVSLMTIYLMQNTDNGDVRIKNGLSKKIDVYPNKYMTRQVWIHWIVKTMLLNGNAIVYPRFKDGLIDDLTPIPYSNVTINDLNVGGYYLIINGVRVDYDEVLHFKINPMEHRPWVGESYKVVLRDVVDNLQQADRTTKDFMGNKIMPSLIIKVDALTDEIAKGEGRERVFDKFVSASKAGVPWIIPSQLIDVEQVKPLTLNDIAIKDTIKLSKETVAGILGIPAFLIGAGEFDEAEYNNFVRTRIASIAMAIEQELTRKLLYSPDLYFKFNNRSLYSYGITELSGVYSELYVRGLCTGNEVRDIIGMSPLEGLDELTILENYIPLDKIGDQKKLGGDDE